MPKVTYRPGTHDPVNTVWNGIEFEANVPVELDDRPEHMIEVDVPITLHTEDGTARTRTMRKKIPMYEAAKNNPFFRVEGAAPPPKVKLTKPKTAEEYKRWATAWIGEALDHELLATRWQNEQELRDKCNCGEAIERELNQLFTRRSDELKRAAGLEDKRKRQRLEAEDVA